MATCIYHIIVWLMCDSYIHAAAGILSSFPFTHVWFLLSESHICLLLRFFIVLREADDTCVYLDAFTASAALLF